MSKIPVLLLISRFIDLNILNRSPRFQPYYFHSLPAMDYLENSSTGQALRNALAKNISDVGAQYLLAHLGLAFDRYPVEFLTAVLDVKGLYPSLQIGLDKGLPYAMQHLKLLTQPGPEVRRLLKRLAQNRSAFSMDDDTAALAACLY